ncbi:MAG TPA: RNA-binding protein [Firmicutes bacterium]|nr:RNA-binding protein [Bacillota bacterium]
MTKTLYVGNLPWSATEEDLMQAFSAYGRVESCRVVTDRETGRSRGFGFVEVDEADVDQVIAGANGLVLGGREVVVNEARPREQREPRRERRY